RTAICFFFFKQKTAYEIGLGIPAEPLFRSLLLTALVLVASLRLARVSYKVQRTINASLNAATSTRAVSSNPNFVTLQKIEIIFEIGRASCRERVSSEGSTSSIRTIRHTTIQ